RLSRSPLDLVRVLSRDDVVGRGAEGVQRAGDDRVAARDPRVHRAHRPLFNELGRGSQTAEAAALVIAGLGARAEAVDDLAVPRRAALALECRDRAGRRVVQDVDDVAGAVEDT